MKIQSSNSLMVIALVISVAMLLSGEAALFVVKPDDVATVVGKAFSYKLSAETTIHDGYTYKLHISGSDDLPSWLTYNPAKNLLLGVPSHHDKGTHAIQLDVVNKETNKTTETINFLTVNVLQYDEDLNHFNLLRPSPLPEQGDKNSSLSPLDCSGHMPVIVATLVFDLSARKLSGAHRVELLKSVSKWSDVDLDQLRLLPGKGDKTAFNLKDVILLTAGPGWVKDAQERGVSVSWKIGCGVNIAGSLSVIRLKSASETGAFERDLSSPVVAWHVAHGFLKHRQVVRVRRQAVGQTPRPTSAVVPSTVVVGTPTLAPSPTLISVTPTATRFSPLPSVTMVTATATVKPTQPPTQQRPENARPRLINPVGTLYAEIDVEFRYPVPPRTFTDLEDGDTPRLKLDMYDPDGSVHPPTFWLKLDSKAQVLHGKPTEKDLGRTVVMLVVTDSGNLISERADNVTVIVVRKNEPPRLINHIDLIKLYVGQPLKFRVPYDTFYDPEDGDTDNLTLSMSTIDDEPLSLSSWVTFDAKTHTIYALPGVEQVGKKPEFQMVATDRGGKKAYDAFEFHVLTVKPRPNHRFGLILNAPYSQFEQSVIVRVKLCILIGGYFGSHFNTSYKDIRVRDSKEGSVELEWSFGNIATDRAQVELYKDKYVLGGLVDEVAPAVPAFAEKVQADCPIRPRCSVRKVYVKIEEPQGPDPNDPNVVGRTEDRGGGTWWKYTIIPAFVIAALIFIIGLIIIVCIRCRRRSKLDKNEKVVFLYRKKPAVFREEYPAKESYGNQPLVSPSEKPPLPPPAYPRSSTPTDYQSPLLSDSSPSYQAPSFDSGNEPGANAGPPVASYRLPPPYVSP